MFRAPAPCDHPRVINALRVTPLVISALLLGAHAFRAGNLPLAIVLAGSPLLLLARRAWITMALQAGLFVGAAEWVRTALQIAVVREMMGQPATRMLVILGAVALFTALSAVPLTRVPVRE